MTDAKGGHGPRPARVRAQAPGAEFLGPDELVARALTDLPDA